MIKSSMSMLQASSAAINVDWILICNTGAIQFVSEFYPKAGDFEKNYLDVDLKARGLIDAAWGPDFKTFPFYDDAKIIRKTIHTL